MLKKIAVILIDQMIQTLELIGSYINQTPQHKAYKINPLSFRSPPWIKGGKKKSTNTKSRIKDDESTHAKGKPHSETRTFNKP